uniref:Umc1048 n=1 Tax=Arundo donax TaxID=35708 RepID=A0A0A9EH24_ARUDO
MRSISRRLLGDDILERGRTRTLPLLFSPSGDASLGDTRRKGIALRSL